MILLLSLNLSLIVILQYIVGFIRYKAHWNKINYGYKLLEK